MQQARPPLGLLGFVIGDSSFDTGSGVNGGDLIIFEVNGWHNLVLGGASRGGATRAA